MFITWSGKEIDVQDIRIEDICIEDIAHHLSNIRRFGGSAPIGNDYSVALHSIYLSLYCWKRTDSLKVAKAALMHDASEAYLGDVIPCIKSQLPEYKSMESYVESLIKRKYRIKSSRAEREFIKECDKRILIDEVTALKPDQIAMYTENNIYRQGLGIEIVSDYTPAQVKDWFLGLCAEMSIKD